jgi:CheY-like chemotaxis protein
MRETAVRHLRSLGYEVLDAGAGASAPDVLAADSDIDFLFTDVVMPGGKALMS